MGGLVDQSSDQGNLKYSYTPSAQALTHLKDEILAEWETHVRHQIKGAKDLLHPILINTVPSFIDNLAEALAEEHPRTFATESTNLAQEHGGERARLSLYSPDQLLKEYLLLRDVILNHLSNVVQLTEKDRSTIQKSFDQAIQEAMMSFFLIHNSIREQFIATLSHDLRNPLGAARMSVDLILTIVSELPDGELRRDLQDLAQRAINNTRRVDHMIQNLLDTTIMQIGERIPLKISECEILSIIKEVIDNLSRKDQARIHLSGAATWGYWDREALRRSIENLISNALKYGSANTAVTIRIVTGNERVMISFHNHGEAIPIEEQECLFQAYRRSFQAKKSGKKGWGIGLALVRGVIESHGGSIGVDSSRERGTTFTIDFPIDARPFLEASVPSSHL
jgi:signal transduction histidine kinase